MSFQSRLREISQKQNTLLCVGLDTDVEKLPKNIREFDNAQFAFNKVIIDATHDQVCAYKPNAAFYEAYGVKGMIQLKLTIEYIRHVNPAIQIILDAKRADIGNTNMGYVRYVFTELGVDAITVHPYLGREALQPFLDQKDKGIIVLCRTSNPGAGEFQDLQMQGKPLYQIVAECVSGQWNGNGNCGVVVGATYPDELKEVRKIVGDMPILIPGIGAQGGDVEKTVRAGIDSAGDNAIINAGRSIIFASGGDDFGEKAKEEAKKLREEINRFRKAQ